MNKYEVKKLFWNIVKEVEGCSDCTIQNDKGVVVERGMLLEDDYSIMFGLDDGVIRIYNKENFPLIAFTEDSEILFILKNLFESLEIIKEAPEVPAQEQYKFVPEDSSGRYPKAEKCLNYLTCSDNHGHASLFNQPE